LGFVPRHCDFALNPLESKEIVVNRGKSCQIKVNQGAEFFCTGLDWISWKRADSEIGVPIQNHQFPSSISGYFGLLRDKKISWEHPD
jgi:hypothetical protein